jgi:hypothetical protein
MSIGSADWVMTALIFGAGGSPEGEDPTEIGLQRLRIKGRGESDPLEGLGDSNVVAATGLEVTMTPLAVFLGGPGVSHPADLILSMTTEEFKNLYELRQ